jgi:hypothetical protein
METLDLRKRYKHLYQPSHRSIELIEVPSLQFAMVDGAIEIHEAPDTSKSFADALQTVYGVSYTLKFLVKQREVDPVQYPVMPLEGLWWVEDGVFDIAVKDNWHYTLMVLQPDVIDPELFAEGLEQIRRKRGNTNALERIRLEIFGEGLCVQTMHIGPYAAEPATIEKIKAFMRENGPIGSVWAASTTRSIWAIPVGQRLKSSGRSSGIQSTKLLCSRTLRYTYPDGRGRRHHAGSPLVLLPRPQAGGSGGGVPGRGAPRALSHPRGSGPGIEEARTAQRRVG